MTLANFPDFWHPPPLRRQFFKYHLSAILINFWPLPITDVVYGRPLLWLFQHKRMVVSKIVHDPQICQNVGAVGVKTISIASSKKKTCLMIRKNFMQIRKLFFGFLITNWSLDLNKWYMTLLAAPSSVNPHLSSFVYMTKILLQARKKNFEKKRRVLYQAVVSLSNFDWSVLIFFWGNWWDPSISNRVLCSGMLLYLHHI